MLTWLTGAQRRWFVIGTRQTHVSLDGNHFWITKNNVGFKFATRRDASGSSGWDLDTLVVCVSGRTRLVGRRVFARVAQHYISQQTHFKARVWLPVV